MQLMQQERGIPAEAVREAKTWLDFQRRFDGLEQSLFDSIVVHEIATATALAARMLGGYAAASEAVYSAFECAKAEFYSYDEAESPRTWVLRHVADEVMQRAADAPLWVEVTAADPRSALMRLAPVRRLAVVLTDVLGMTNEDAASVAGMSVAELRQHARSARAWLTSHMASDINGRAAG